MKEQRFRKMEIWKKSMDFIEKIYKITAKFPHKEEYGLISQVRRASTSIALNIADSRGADSDELAAMINGFIKKLRAEG